MKKILTIIIVVCFAVNSAGQACPYALFSKKTVGGYALRPVSFALDESCKSTLFQYQSRTANPLDIFKKSALKDFVGKRLLAFYELCNLPVERIEPILSLLDEHQFDEKKAVLSVRRAFPDLVNRNSRYVQIMEGLNRFKAQNIARLIGPYVRDGVLVDIGGGLTIYAEELIESNSAITHAYVTDINPRRGEVRNPKVEFKVQETPYETSFGYNSVDTVTMTMMLHHTDYSARRKLLTHITNIMRPGGRVIIIEDTYSQETRDVNKGNELIKQFLSFTDEEKYSLLVFMDWFGNRIARNLPRIPLLYTHETMEDWQHLFEDSGFKTIKTIFLDSNEMLIGLVPPRGVLVFEYPALPIDVKDCAMLQPQHIVKAISASA